MTEMLSRSEVPLSAYDLAALIRGDGMRITPVAVYRSLDRLCRRHEAEKVVTLSAYRIKDRAKALLMICQGCDRTRSVSASKLHDAIVQIMSETGFCSDGIAIEVTGYCQECQRTADHVHDEDA
ncbi:MULTISPECIES: Fur family transcriptional regulator [Sphingobium]|uniref:Fur family transcriptional regulator n=1 Tax=Sphingobium TaxID=165695 RepID=UPI0011D08DFC|nr:hypothetical protein [Sphingobium indicum]